MIDSKKEMFCEVMSENLPLFRAKLRISQEQLADMVDVTRQTISSFENKTRKMPWSLFLAFLMLFVSNSQTYNLVLSLGLYNDELKKFFNDKK